MSRGFFVSCPDNRVRHEGIFATREEAECWAKGHPGPCTRFYRRDNNHNINRHRHWESEEDVVT
jgi:hypothetical protein